jgi:foldase protein PrsA
MKLKTWVLLTLIALLAVGCRVNTAEPETATPVEESATTEEAPTAAPTDTPAPAVNPTLSAAEPVTPTGGVEVALAAIEPVEGVLATVNGQELTWEDYEPELNQTLHSITIRYGVDWNLTENSDRLPSLQDQVLQTLIERTVLRQGAAEEGLEVDQEAVDALYEEESTAVADSGQFGSFAEFLEQFGLTEQYLRRLMADTVLVDVVGEAKAPSREAEQVRARHILVEDEETGQDVLARLEEGEEWAALASELSIDTSNKDNEGDLGWFPRSRMVAEFEEVAFALEPGETSDLVETQFGFHIIQVLEKEMRELDDQTYDALVAQAFQTWLEEKKAAAEISVEVAFSEGE